MKYGLLYYKDTDNIGDDIQSYAASQFLPKIDYLVDRENLEGFIPNKKESVKVIMNAWYIHDKYNFDISPYIKPLYISMFLKRFPYEGGITIDTDYLNDNLIKSFRENGPVGTRDEHTKKVLDKLEVDNYFSGCMTLTINKFANINKGDYIVTVGLNDEEIEYIKTQSKREVIKFIQDVPTGSYSDETWEQRKKRVEDTLKLYQGAHMVITSKLHCSLPCLALGTPILLLYDGDKYLSETKDRLGTFLPYLNYITRDDFFKANIDFDKPKKNSKKYLELRKSLEEKCQNFISDNSKMSTTNLPNINDYKISLEKSRNMRKILIKNVSELQNIYEKECLKSSSMHDKIDELNAKYEGLLINYNTVINSKNWQRLEKIRKILRR